eukprot:672024-Amphidinium_carterae.1
MVLVWRCASGLVWSQLLDEHACKCRLWTEPAHVCWTKCKARAEHIPQLFCVGCLIPTWQHWGGLSFVWRWSTCRGDN